MPAAPASSTIRGTVAARCARRCSPASPRAPRRPRARRFGARAAAGDSAGALPRGEPDAVDDAGCDAVAREDGLPLLHRERNADDRPEDRVLVTALVPGPAAEALDHLQRVGRDEKDGGRADGGVAGADAQNQRDAGERLRAGGDPDPELRRMEARLGEEAYRRG